MFWLIVKFWLYFFATAPSFVTLAVIFKEMNKIIILIFVIISTISCNSFLGEEIGRINIEKVSTSDENSFPEEITLNLKKGEKISFWSEMDFEYFGEEEFRFLIDIYKDDELYGDFEIDPLDKSITIGEIKTTIDDKTNWSFTGKNITLNIDKEGKYRFNVLLITSNNPTTVINKSILIIKK